MSKTSAKFELKQELWQTQGLLRKLQRHLGQLSDQLPLFGVEDHQRDVALLERSVKRLLNKEAALVEQIGNLDELWDEEVMMSSIGRVSDRQGLS